MDLYAVDDDNRNARDHRPGGGGGGTSVLRPVNLRPVAIAQPSATTTYAQPQPNYAQPNYAQPNGFAPNGFAPNGYAPNGFAPNGYVQPGYMMPGGPGFFPGYAGGWGGRSWGQGWGGPGYAWQTPYGPVFAGGWGMGMGMGSNAGSNLASGLASLVEIGTSVVAAFQSLPVAPNADESTVLANVVDYQTRLAQHAKGDERLRTIGSAGGKVIDLVGKLFANPSSGPGGAFMSPRWGWY